MRAVSSEQILAVKNDRATPTPLTSRYYGHGHREAGVETDSIFLSELM